ncbi:MULTISPECIES: spore germination protein [unclassified Virgibacillus]|uniref:spore germination protein n=1 Tax=unclassified Virgibacillus TaxID=2620237 RepID=UPI0024DEA9D8|nr:spore germination protein [Virgibacillus sp. LDC-1]
MRRKYMRSKAKREQSTPDIGSSIKETTIEKNLNKTVQIFQSLYSFPKNKDVTIRHFHIPALQKDAALLHISTITSAETIDTDILKPLMTINEAAQQIDDLITVPSTSKENKVKTICKKINEGSAAIFIDGEEEAILINVAKFEGRSVEQPQNENVVKGPKEAFNELAQTNISLVRKKIKSESLVAESFTISKRSKNELYVLYISDLVDDKLLANVKKRVQSLNTDSIQNLGILEQYIEERRYSIFPSTLYTERPDRAASFLEDGYIVLVMDNDPACLVLPATFWSFFHSSEDHYLRFMYGNFIRLLRLIALFISVFISAIYVAITNFHSEMIPGDLLLAIIATRDKVPFPGLVEVLLMELSFELIREAGLRVPTPIGPTIGIVGALILGQAAVQANIVSPIVVIAVALSGLSSFAIGDLSMNFAIRLMKFLFIFAAGLVGIFGITALFTVGFFYLVSIKSFGVPYFSPLAPSYQSSGDTIFRRTLQNELFRPGYVKPKDITKR